MHSLVENLLETAVRGEAVPHEAAEALLPLVSGSLTDLMAAAGLTASAGRSEPFTCGIVNAKSGRCQENCTFCAQAGCWETGASVYPLVSDDSLLRQAEVLAASGVNYMGIVTSGAGPTERETGQLCRTAERIRRAADIRLCASFGLLRPGQAEQIAAAGFTSYHHNLETARSHYHEVCTSHEYSLRVQTVMRARDAGLRVCSGGIFGVGESWQQRLELSAELGRLDVDSIPVNFLVPVPGTPLGSAEPLSPAEGLAVIALFRLMHPHRDIVICGGRSSLGRYKELVFPAGANGIMVGDYLTTGGIPLEEDMAMLDMLGMRR